MNAKLVKRLRRRGGNRATASSFWYIRHRRDGDTVWKLHNTRVTDKRVAEQLMANFVREAEREAHGIIPPKLQRDAAAKSLADHLADFVADLKAKGRRPGYVYNIKRHIEIVSAACGWVYLRDITADSYIAWRSTLVGKSAKTLNEYAAFCNSFFNWLVGKRCLVANPLASVGRVVGETVRRRRSITAEQTAALLAIAGPRRIVYVMALLTGLRRRELRTLAWSDLHLDADHPCIQLRAKNEKNRRGSTVPLHPQLADELAAMHATCKGPLVLGKLVPAMPVYRADLEAAGIPYKDDDGRQFDFHALRHTFGTNLSRAGVPLIQAMHLMRHSDPKLTAKVYTDSHGLPLLEAVGKLAALPAAASGTHIGTHGSVPASLVRSHSVKVFVKRANENRPVLPGDCRDLSQVVPESPGESESWGTRIRT